MNEPRFSFPGDLFDATDPTNQVDDFVDDSDHDVAHYLETFAAARLTPDDAAMRAMRTRMVDAARARAALPAPAADDLIFLSGRRGSHPSTGSAAPLPFERRAITQLGDGPAGSRTAAGGRRHSFRRPLTAAMGSAVALSMLAGVCAAASGPGEPLYGARLGVETALLPATADARVDAEITRLNSRLVEVSKASTRGDAPAAAAALDAYQSIVSDALTSAGGSLDRESRILTELQRHHEVFVALEGRLPGKAADELNVVLDRSKTTIARITEHASHHGGSTAGSGAATGTEGTTNTTTGSGTGTGGSDTSSTGSQGGATGIHDWSSGSHGWGTSHSPEPSPTPSATSTPTPTPTPTATHRWWTKPSSGD